MDPKKIKPIPQNKGHFIKYINMTIMNKKIELMPFHKKN